jgi:hypothetical protein
MDAQLEEVGLPLAFSLLVPVMRNMGSMHDTDTDTDPNRAIKR